MIFFAIVFIVLLLFAVNIYVKRDPITRLKVTHTREFDKTVCEPNEEFVLTTKIKSNSYHPMTRIYVKHLVDGAFELSNEPKYKVIENENAPDKKLLVCRTNVKSKGERVIETKLKIDRRGVYHAYKIGIDCVDTMGFYSSYYNKENLNKIIVAPKRVDTSFISQLITSGYGDYNAKRGLFDDETSVSTYAEYTGREPMKQISWKKSAKEGNLMVKKFEPMGAHITTVVFDISGFNNSTYGSKNYELIEYCISMLRETFEYFEKKRISYRLYTNAISDGIEDNVFYSIPSGKQTMLRMLAMLGQIKYNLQNSEVTPSKKLLDFAIRNSYRAPFLYLAPQNKSLINLQLKKVSKSKGLEIVELYAEQFCKFKD